MSKNPLIAPNLSDEIQSCDGKDTYLHDCHNLPICKSYGEVSYSCLAGAFCGTRCSIGKKVQIRILNDMNPNAIYKPEKPHIEEITDYAGA